jgi:hypothetical protein
MDPGVPTRSDADSRTTPGARPRQFVVSGALACGAGGLTAVTGFVVSVGRAFDPDALKSVVPEPAAMNSTPRFRLYDGRPSRK